MATDPQKFLEQKGRRREKNHKKLKKTNRVHENKEKNRSLS